MRSRRTDTKHREVARAIELVCGAKKDLSATGGGVGDFLAPMRPRSRPPFWLEVEVKTPRNKRGEATESQFTPAQKKWYAATEGLPRIVVTGFEDALRQLRELMG